MRRCVSVFAVFQHDAAAAHALAVEGNKQLQEAARAAFQRTLDAQQKPGGSQAPVPAN
jgi:hypothetical protein